MAKDDIEDGFQALPGELESDDEAEDETEVESEAEPEPEFLAPQPDMSECRHYLEDLVGYVTKNVLSPPPGSGSDNPLAFLHNAHSYLQYALEDVEEQLVKHFEVNHFEDPR
ncbi:hypothetical protein [Candidatus Liberibacter americanus]|uniref:Uncharacterized protein n=1 Tax=Candidatus Liberibacter americanus str. Sao Paulo TaxID=1261131 RepID=U6B8A7_9HYPH|nr:hypothetical protein [Candidatus Liberibacter americanus]AHA28101.1 hypothetical protein lam_758 [Candidatus Liberibacter americanus str. Sao Paulo]EMS36052.1 hypothetical protein G653_03626 [Candidatus Liberibacter americanus PW_SP]